MRPFRSISTELALIMVSENKRVCIYTRLYVLRNQTENNMSEHRYYKMYELCTRQLRTDETMRRKRGTRRRNERTQHVQA